MSIKSYQHSYSAGETKEFIGGGFFTIEQLTDEVTLTIKSPQGNVIGVVENIGAGFWINLEDKSIGSIDVYSATAQTINIIIGQGEFGVNKTSTSITGGTLDPHTLSSSYYYSGASTALKTIIAPASNINGVKVTNAGGYVYTANQSNTRIMAKSSAPSSIGDTDALTLALIGIGNTTQSFVNQLQNPVIVPAGLGIYEWSSEVNYQKTFVNYEIL